MKKMSFVFLSFAGRKLRILLFIYTAFFSMQLHANEVAETEREKQILNSCSSYRHNSTDSSAQICSYYIQGYLSGAWGINNVKGTKLKKKKQTSPTWTERAYINRVGNRGERDAPKRTTYFCSPEDNAEAKILKELSTKFNNFPKTIRELHAQIYTAITEVCESDEKVVD